MCVELDACNADTGQVSASLERYGSVVLRGAVSNAQSALYDAALSAIFQQRTDALAGDIPSLDRFSDFQPSVLDALDSGNMPLPVFEEISGRKFDSLFENRTIHGVLARFLAKPFPLNRTFLTVGRSKHSIPGLAMHTDGIIQGTDALVLCAWTPFQHCGQDAPGLSLILASRTQVLSYLQRQFPTRTIPGWCSTTEWNHTNAFTPESLEQEFGGESLYHPILAPGDVVLFTNWTIHGSRILPDMTRDRRAAVMRWTN